MNKKNASIIYHRTDSDGIFSYAIVHKVLEKEYDIIAVPYNHGDKEPDTGFLFSRDLVVIVDICLPRDTMRTLYDETRKRKDFDCVWIDHHKSSIEESVSGGWYDMHGYRNPEGKAACHLAWDYFHGMASKVPWAVTLISAYDIHDTKNVFVDWETETLPFQYGIREAYDLRVEDLVKDYDKLFGSREHVLELIRNGARIYRYEKNSGMHAVECWGFPVTVNGKHKALCCLTNRFGSLAFEDRMKREGMELAICVNRIDADKYKAAIYAPGKTTLDIGKYLAVHYGGGGHRGAGGCTLNFEQFKRLMTEAAI